MTKEEFSKLLKKYLDGRASQEEAEWIEKFYTTFQEEEPGWERWDFQEKEQINEQLLSKVKGKIGERQKKGVVRRIAMGTAAAMVLFILGYWIMNRNDSDVGSIVYPTEMTITAHQGGQSVLLKDGTYVYLKDGAKLTYPSALDGAMRMVKLEGEAWFDVKRDTLRPFKVLAGTITTTVLGTSFNIAAHPGDREVRVAVTSGKVSVSDSKKELSILMKDQQLLYNTESRTFGKEELVGEKRRANLQPDEYRMEDITMAEAAEFLKKRWEEDIVFENEKIKDCRLFASFEGEDSLEDILVIICGISNSRYRVEQERIVIYGEGCKKY